MAPAKPDDHTVSLFQLIHRGIMMLVKVMTVAVAAWISLAEMACSAILLTS